MQDVSKKKHFAAHYNEKLCYGVNSSFKMNAKPQSLCLNQRIRRVVSVQESGDSVSSFRYQTRQIIVLGLARKLYLGQILNFHMRSTHPETAIPSTVEITA